MGHPRRSSLGICLLGRQAHQEVVLGGGSVRLQAEEMGPVALLFCPEVPVQADDTLAGLPEGSQLLAFTCPIRSSRQHHVLLLGEQAGELLAARGSPAETNLAHLLQYKLKHYYVE